MPTRAAIGNNIIPFSCCQRHSRALWPGLGRHRFDRTPKPRYSLHDPLIIRVGEVQPHGVLPTTIGEERLPRHEGDILLYGTPEQLKEFAFDLSRGARYARVIRIEQFDAPLEGLSGFGIRK